VAQTFVKANELAVFNSTGLSSSFQVINSAGLAKPSFYIRIVNDSNQDIYISFDGVTNHEYLASGTDWALPSQNNAQPAANLALWRAYEKAYVKSVSGSAGTGFITLSAYYV